MSLLDMLNAFDSHEFAIVHMCILFDVGVFYSKSGSVKDVNAMYEVANGEIAFKFFGDYSMGYRHKFSDYVHLLVENVLVTPGGRCYVFERTDFMCGTLFIKATYCALKPMKAEFGWRVQRV
uniref:Replicase large subunit n=2 Tax=Cacopsylla melanoneura TaxID=428564 RepID=A0A8D9F8H5_9HEMI